MTNLTMDLVVSALARLFRRVSQVRCEGHGTCKGFKVLILWARATTQGSYWGASFSETLIYFQQQVCPAMARQ